jgi:hypothetical protein
MDDSKHSLVGTGDSRATNQPAKAAAFGDADDGGSSSSSDGFDLLLEPWTTHGFFFHRSVAMYHKEHNSRNLLYAAVSLLSSSLFACLN